MFLYTNIILFFVANVLFNTPVALVAIMLKQLWNNLLTHLCHNSCADPESFARGGPTLTMFFFCLS